MRAIIFALLGFGTMKWGELLYQVTSTSKEVRARIVQDTLLTYVSSLTELTVDDCKGVIGVVFGSVMGYVHDRKTQALLQEVCSPFQRRVANVWPRAMGQSM